MCRTCGWWRTVCTSSSSITTGGGASFDDQGRSRVMHENRGLLKVYAAQSTGLAVRTGPDVPWAGRPHINPASL